MGDGAAGEGFYFLLRAGFVGFFVPAGECGEEDEAEEGEDDCYDSVFYVIVLLLAVVYTISGKKAKEKKKRTYKRYGKTTASLNVDATHIKLRGSWPTVTVSANAVALALQIYDPSSGWTQIPKNPTLTSNSAPPTTFDVAVTTPGSTCAALNKGLPF